MDAGTANGGAAIAEINGPLVELPLDAVSITETTAGTVGVDAAIGVTTAGPATLGATVAEVDGLLAKLPLDAVFVTDTRTGCTMEGRAALDDESAGAAGGDAAIEGTATGPATLGEAVAGAKALLAKLPFAEAIADAIGFGAADTGTTGNDCCGTTCTAKGPLAFKLAERRAALDKKTVPKSRRGYSTLNPKSFPLPK